MRDHPAPLAARDLDLPLDDHALRVRLVAHVARPATARPTLVFLHDSLGSITLWRDFPERLALATGCDALVYDRRGYGASSPFPAEPRTPRYLEEEADVLARVLAGCGVAQAVLFGHSDGGSIALVAAAVHPARIRAIVTEGAHVFVEALTLHGIRRAVDAWRTTNLRERVARYHGDKTEGVFAAWTETWLAPAFRDWDITGYLGRVTCPTLVLQGIEDEYGTAAQVDAIRAGVAGPVEAHLVHGAAHSPHREAREETERLTLAFLHRELPELRAA